MPHRLLAAAALLALASCVSPSSPTSSTPRGASSTTAPQDASERPGWAAPPIERAVSVRDGHTGELASFDALLDALATADVVFLGESHDDETTHRVELAVYEGLLARRENRLVLAMEMFERDVQGDLDAYLARRIDEATFLSRARPWGNYRTGYRPLIERAKTSGVPVVASNFPAALRRRIAREGRDVLDSLDGDERRHAPSQLLPNTEAYWRRVDNAVRSHRAMMGGTSDEDRLYSTQSLWDNSMGEACAQALDDHPDHAVLHINGGFHSLYWDGTVHQLRQRKPNAKVLTVAIRPRANPATAELGGTASADWVVFAEERAKDRREGTWSVQISQDRKYRIRVPETADDAHPAPLLIWLGDDGFTSQDGLELWKDRLGDEVAIAALDAPYREVAADLGTGGRWFWANDFLTDVGSSVNAVERIWGYILRRFPVDPARVCIAGEGTGATVATAVALFADDIDCDVIAFGPRHYSRLKDFPLPLPELDDPRPSPGRTLRVIVDEDDREWWTKELAEYVEVGLDAAAAPPQEDRWQVELAAENALRAAVELEAQHAPAETTRRYVFYDGDSPRGRFWARLHALRATAEDGAPVAVLDAPPLDRPDAELLPLAIRPDAFAAPHALPRCPGPFGGTTVVVLPASASRGALKRWLAVQEDDPLTKLSRFHRLRIATMGGEHALPDVLSTLHSEGRDNILIVPALFCADAAMMRSLERSARDLEDVMTFHWSPGLGGRMGAGPAASAPADAPIDHELVVALDPETHRVSVRDTMLLPPGISTQQAEFSLHAGLAIRSSEPAIEKIATDDDEGIARYRLSSVPVDGEVRLEYDGVFDYALSDQKEEYTRGFRSTRGIIGAEGVYLDGGSGWVPRFEDRLLRFTVDVELPADWRVVSQGKGIARDDDGHARWDSEGKRMEQVYLVGGPLRVYRESAGSAETLVYLHEEDEALARKYLDAAARYIEMYRDLIGPYPYAKFALVENFWETGYGMPSFTLLGPQVIRLPFILHSSFPHEILHNWWGNSVFVDYDSGNWCEGLTAYMADHLVQEQRGKGHEYRRNTLQKYRDYVKEGRDFPLSEFRSRHSAATEAVGYGKALMLFHMLRRHVGDEAFRKALAGFYRAQRGKRASFDDVRKAFEEATEEDLTAFFTQWVQRTGAPVLALAAVESAQEADGYRLTGTLEQKQERDPFALEVPLQVFTEKGVESFVIVASEREHRFSLTVDSRPLSIAADAMFDVFRILDPRETPPALGQIFGAPQVLAVLPGDADALEQERYRRLVDAWKSDEHEIDMAVDTDLATGVDALPADRAVWILGRRNRLAPAFLAGVPGVASDTSATAFDFGGVAVPFADHSLVVVHRHPRDIEKAVGWIVADPDAAVPGLARKLPHYGKYSYLAFEGAEPNNVIKGQWPTSGSPLVVTLDPDRAPRSPEAENRAALAELPPVFSRRALVEHVEWLASPDREGRGLGSKGIDQSAEYIAERMKAAGLEPGGDDGGWLQRFAVEEGPGGKPVEAANVVGILRGKRDDWNGQAVVLGAHYDHLGRGWPDAHSGDEGKVHPGADDNASGVAVLLELARVLASEGRPSRSLVFVAFSAEENGRLGSQHWVAHPLVPLDGLRGVVNLDTVGRLFDGKISVFGTGTTTEWPHIFRGCGFVTGIANAIVAGSAEGSDQASFIDRGVPAVQIFTGAHEDYHRPGDTADKIDGAGLVKVATFVKEALSYLVEREAPLTSRIDGAAEAPTSPHGASGARKVTLGTVPDFEFAGRGVRIASIVDGSPAAAAGLQAGDVIVSLAAQDIADLRAMSRVLAGCKPDQEVDVVVLRDGERVTVQAKLRKR